MSESRKAWTLKWPGANGSLNLESKNHPLGTIAIVMMSEHGYCQQYEVVGNMHEGQVNDGYPHKWEQRKYMEDKWLLPDKVRAMFDFGAVVPSGYPVMVFTPAEWEALNAEG